MGKKKAILRKASGQSSPLANSAVESISHPAHRRPILPILTASISCIALYFTYVYTGAEDLRVKVYEPMFGEASKLETLASSDSIQTPPLGAYDDLSRTGGLQRVPTPIRNRISTLYHDYAALTQDVLSVTGFLQRRMSREVMAIRTEASDREWNTSVAQQLRAESTAVPGISSITQSQFTHDARSRGIDVRDPQHPIVSAPGGPTWTFADWAGYPGSVAEIEKMWTDKDYLYFDAALDAWYYRITRSDLTKAGVSLTEFLRPVHDALVANPDFQHLPTSRSKVKAEARAVTEQLAQRLRQPKELWDIFR